MDISATAPRSRTALAPRLALAGYSGFAYAVFLLALAWAVVFLTGIGRGPLVDADGVLSAPAVAVDLALLGIFAGHHSLMARSGAKRMLARVLPAAAERSTYVMVASAALMLLCWQWRPLPGTIWAVPGPAGYAVAAVGWVGWICLLASTFMIDHLDLFGLRQGWRAFTGRADSAPEFRVRWFYRWVRHPMMTSFLFVFWAAPRMTVGHLLLAGAATAYIVVGTTLEERDLVRAIPQYAAYRSRVGRLVPRLLPRRDAVAPAAASRRTP